MPQYKVKEPGFFGGILRTPGGRHDPVVTAAPITKKDLPEWLEEIVPETSPNKKAATVTKPNEKVSDFMGDTKKDDDSGLETL